MTVNVLSPCHVHEISPGTHTFFPTYTCPVYCWRSVQLLDFGLCCNLLHASQPIRTSFTGQCFASGFLQTPFHNDALAFDCILPTAGRIRDFHPLERAPAGRTANIKYSKTMEYLMPRAVAKAKRAWLWLVAFARIMPQRFGRDGI